MANSENSCLSPPPDDSGAGLVCSVEPPPELIPTNEGVDWRERRRVMGTSGMVDLFREEIRRGKWEDAVLTANGLSPDDLKEQLGYADWDVPCSRLKMLRAARARPNNDSSRVVDALQPVAALLDALDAKKWEQVNKVLVGFADRDIAFVYKGLPDSDRDDLERAATDDGVLPDNGARFLRIFLHVRITDRIKRSFRACRSGGPGGSASQNAVDYLVLRLWVQAYSALFGTDEGRWKSVREMAEIYDNLLAEVLRSIESTPELGIINPEINWIIGTSRGNVQLLVDAGLSSGEAHERRFKKAEQGLALSRDFVGAATGDQVSAKKVARLAAMKTLTLYVAAAALGTLTFGRVAFTGFSRVMLAFTPEGVIGTGLLTQNGVLLVQAVGAMMDAATLSNGIMALLMAASGKNLEDGRELSTDDRAFLAVDGLIQVLPTATEGALVGRQAIMQAVAQMRGSSSAAAYGTVTFLDSLRLGRAMSTLSKEEIAILHAAVKASKDSETLSGPVRDNVREILKTKMKFPKDMLPLSAAEVTKAVMGTTSGKQFIARFRPGGEDALRDAGGDIKKAQALLIERQQVVRLPEGEGLAPPTQLGGTLFIAVLSNVDLDTVFEGGLPQRGSNLDLLEYCKAGSGEEYAFRAAYSEGVKAAFFLLSGVREPKGHVLLIDGIPSWNVAALLKSGSQYSHKGDYVVTGAIPGPRIIGALPIVSIEASKPTLGALVHNAGYKPK